MTKSILLAVALFTLTACAGDPSKIKLSETTPVDKTEAATDDKVAAKVADQKTYKKVCKEEIVTGTRFSKKTCRTQEAWDELERRAKETLDHNNSMQTNNPTGG